jgi:hypothetical protein
MRKVKGPAVAFIMSFAAGICLSWLIAFLPTLLFSPLDGGPLDYLPRLESSAQSPDGELIVKVYRRRDPFNSRYVGAEMFARVSDKNGRLLYQTVIGTEGAWDEMNNAFKDIEFRVDTIRISSFFERAYIINVPPAYSSNSLNATSQWYGYQVARSDNSGR